MVADDEVDIEGREFVGTVLFRVGSIEEVSLHWSAREAMAHVEAAAVKHVDETSWVRDFDPPHAVAAALTSERGRQVTKITGRSRSLGSERIFRVSS